MILFSQPIDKSNRIRQLKVRKKGGENEQEYKIAVL